MKRHLIYSLAFLALIACTKESNDENNDKNENTRPTSGQSIDLGLSVNWAGWNIGASSPQENGDYFAWGETTGKEIYHWDNYYFMNSEGDYDFPSNNISGTKYDAATVKWGNEWRMPTAKEFQELIDNCVWEYAQYNGKWGYFVTGSNGNSIFIPAAGFHWEKNSELQDEGQWGQYLTGERSSSFSIGLLFCDEYAEVSNNNPVYIGLPIRAVNN